MATTATMTFRFSGAGDPDELAVARTGSSETHFEESVANGQTAFLINIAIDVSAVVAFYLVSDQAVTVKTNSSGSPDNTLTLVANEPYLFRSSDYTSFLLTADVTKFYVANSSGSSATVKCKVVQDSSP